MTLIKIKSYILTSKIIVLRNPIYFIFLILCGIAAYVTYTLNLWGPIIRMMNAASTQGLEIGKEKLRDFLKDSDVGRQALGMQGRDSDADAISLNTLDSRGKRASREVEEDEDEI